MIKLFLPENPEIIKEKIYKIVLDRMLSNPHYKENASQKAKQFTEAYKVKYYFFLDYIIKTKIYFNIDYAIFPRERMLNSVLGKIRWKFKGGKLFNIIRDDLIDIGYVEKLPYKSSKGNYFLYSSDQGLATKYQIIGDNEYKSYFFDCNTENKNVLQSIINYKIKQKEKRKNEIDLSNDLVKYNLRFMMDLDFSQVDTSNLSDIEEWQVEKFIKNDFIINNKSTGRTYTTFTNLKKTIRKNLQINGERVIGVDITNSQIVFLAEVLKENLKGKEMTKATIHLLKYIRLGKFYELMWKLTEYTEEKVKDIVLIGEERDIVKKQVFSYIYNDTKNYEMLIEDVFKQYFPQAYSCINTIRGKSLALQMQSTEANIINTAYRNIIKQGILAGTLFDSIYAAESEISIVMQELKNVFLSRGITASLKYTENDVNSNDELELSQINSLIS